MKHLLLLVLGFSLLSSLVLQAQEIELPKYLTLAESEKMATYVKEAKTKLSNDANLLASPKRTMGEWEEIQALTIAWSNSFKGIQREIVRHAKEECDVIILCKNCESVKTDLTNAGIDYSANVEFIPTDYNSLWIRDYGPNTVYTNDVDSLVIVDWIYNRPRPKDDVTPYTIADFLNIPILGTTDFPQDLVHTGGNFMADGMGIGFSSNLILDENGPNNNWGQSNHSAADIDNIMNEYMGIEEYIKMTVLPYDAIHHIDMHMKLLDEETLLIGSYPENVADGPIIEANIEYIKSNFKTSFGRDFDIVRITMPPDAFGSYPDNNGDYRTYTNAVFVNNTVLLPTYEEKYDTTAIRIWQEQLPGHKIVGINCNSIIPLSGAIHCITKEIGVNDPLLIHHARMRTGEFDPAADYEINATIQHQSGISEASVFYSQDEWDSFSVKTMSLVNAETNEWSANIPANSPGEKTQYYIQAIANSGKSIKRPITSPEGAWEFEEPTAVSNENLASTSLSVRAFPNPSSALVCVKFNTSGTDKISAALFDAFGKKVSDILVEKQSAAEITTFFNAGDFIPGTYFLHVVSENQQIVEKIVLF